MKDQTHKAYALLGLVKISIQDTNNRRTKSGANAQECVDFPE